jgi:hypothetical protein
MGAKGSFPMNLLSSNLRRERSELRQYPEVQPAFCCQTPINRRLSRPSTNYHQRRCSVANERNILRISTDFYVETSQRSNNVRALII